MNCGCETWSLVPNQPPSILRIKWIRTSRLSIKKSLSGNPRRHFGQRRDAHSKGRCKYYWELCELRGRGGCLLVFQREQVAPLPVPKKRVEGSGCRVQGAGFRVQGSGCRVQVSGSAGGHLPVPYREQVEPLQRETSVLTIYWSEST